MEAIRIAVGFGAVPVTYVVACWIVSMFGLTRHRDDSECRYAEADDELTLAREQINAVFNEAERLIGQRASNLARINLVVQSYERRQS